MRDGDDLQFQKLQKSLLYMLLRGNVNFPAHPPNKLWLVIKNLYFQQNIFKFCRIIKKGKPWLTGRRESVPSWMVGAHNVSKKQSGGRDLPDNMGPPVVP